MKRGEIRWYSFSPPDKKRPILLLTRTSVIAYLGEVTVAPLTSTIRDIPSEVVVTKEDGMHCSCAINCDHLQTIAKSKIGPVITTLSYEKMEEVKKAIAFSLDL
jgi:mRNA interferase MazF